MIDLEDFLIIVITIAVLQICLDSVFFFLFYQKDSYQQVCDELERARQKLTEAKAVLSKNPKKRNQKRLQYAEDEYENARAVVVSERKFPSTLSFLFFFIFLPIGLLPPILRANKDSALPVYIYFLSAMTIKFYCNKFFGTQHPRGTEVGIFTYMESPQVNSLPACLLPGQDYYFALGHGSKTSGHSSCAPRLLLPTHEFDLRRTPQHADFAGTYLP